MQPKNTVLLLAHLGYLPFIFAEDVITVPVVGYGNSMEFFDGYEGRLIGESANKTTYAVNCPPQTTGCIAFNPGYLTFIAGPSTYDVIYSNYADYTSSGCTFTGAPTPTTATCSYSQSYHIGSHTVTREETYSVPGETVYRDIYSASLTVAGTGPAPATATATGTEASEDSEDTGSATTDTPTGNLAAKTAAPMVLAGGMLAGLAVNL